MKLDEVGLEVVLGLDETEREVVLELDEVKREIVPERDEGGREAVLEMDEEDEEGWEVVMELDEVAVAEELATEEGEVNKSGTKFIVVVIAVGECGGTGGAVSTEAVR